MAMTKPAAAPGLGDRSSPRDQGKKGVSSVYKRRGHKGKKR